MSGAVEEHQIVDIADPLDPVEVAANQILRLPHGARLAEMLAQHLCGRQKATLDTAGIGDRIAEIPIGLGKLPFLFLDRADIGPDAAIAGKDPLVVKDRHAAEADIDGSAVTGLELVLEPPEFPPRLKIGDVAGKFPLQVGIHRNILAAAADDRIGRKARDLEEPVGNEREPEFAVHFEEPVSGHFGELTEPLLGISELRLRPVEPPDKQAGCCDKRVIGLDDGPDLVVMDMARTDRLAGRRIQHRLAKPVQRCQHEPPECHGQADEDDQRQQHHDAGDDRGFVTHRLHQDSFIHPDPVGDLAACAERHGNPPVIAFGSEKVTSRRRP